MSRHHPLRKSRIVHYSLWIFFVIICVLQLGGCSQNIMFALQEVTLKDGDRIYITNRFGIQSEWVILDKNNDGLADGIDITLDGTIDLPFTEVSTQQQKAVYTITTTEIEIKIEILPSGFSRFLSLEGKPLTFDFILVREQQNQEGTVRNVIFEGLSEV